MNIDPEYEREAFEAAKKDYKDDRPFPRVYNIPDITDPHKKSLFNVFKIEAFRKTAVGNTINSDFISEVNLMAAENGKLHHTDAFHSLQLFKTPIFRRGQPFSLTIAFQQPFQLTGNNLTLDFMTGSPQHQSQESHVRLTVTKENEFPPTKNWAVRTINNTGKLMKLEVRISPTSPIGLWKMSVASGATAVQVPKNIYILFNPWCKDDAVFMSEEEKRKEFVLNQSGLVYQGTYGKPGALAWNYNQFFPVTLPAALTLLEASPFQNALYYNPVDVCRSLSCAGYFALEGKWPKDGIYTDGVNPNEWIGSQRLLEMFMTHFQRVRYTQCWVYAAVATSLCRALGIPSRPVSNFGSGHDHNRDLVIEHKDAPGRDFYWNFHVWTEGWMSRPDLPAGYGGWQAFDATPQEFSAHGKTKIMACGPASVAAIKKGEVNHPYDGLFIYSEVNADLREWETKQNPFQRLKLINYNTTAVGIKALTKAVGSNNTEDVIGTYKYAENTAEERQTIYLAAKLSGIKLPTKVAQVAQEEVFFDLLPLESVLLGQPMRIIVKVENRSKTPHRVVVSLSADSILYNGMVVQSMDLSGGTNKDFVFKKDFTLKPEQNEMVNIDITPEQYLKFIHISNHFRIDALGVVGKLNQSWHEMSNFHIRKPKIKMEMPAEIKVGKPFTLKMSFKNPLNKELHNCKFNIDPNCSSKNLELKFRNVKPMEDVVHQTEIKPEFAGPCVVVAVFFSDNLTDVTGSKIANCS